jgi:hypothetical protein
MSLLAIAACRGVASQRSRQPVVFGSCPRLDRRKREAEGVCQCGYREPLSFRYQAIISAAGPVAEARIRHAKLHDCVMAGEDYEIMMRSVTRGLVTFGEA